MSDADAQRLGPLGWFVILLTLLLIIVGTSWRGVSLATITRLWDALAERPDGPMMFRFIVHR